MDALLIVDMQKGSFRSAPRYDAGGVIARIRGAAEFCRETGRPVIFIQHDGSAENLLVTGTEDWEILDELPRLPQDIIVSKKANDSFYGTDLQARLKKLGARHLLICGCATDFCVNATVHGALTRDYDVTVLADGHTTADRPGLKASQLVEFHNWLWGSLTPTGGRIVVETADRVFSFPGG